MKRLLIVDGNSILNRAFYGVHQLTTKDGLPTNALYGMTSMVMRQVEEIHPDYCAVAFDLKAPTFRHKAYSEYKAGRRPTPPELLTQLPLAKDLMSALGFRVLSLEGYEADDILGTVSKWCADGDDCMAYLMTGDRDALQLIGEKVHVLLATNQETVDMDEGRFFEKYGVRVDQFVDVKALMGDSSDHVPGVPGIGEKTAFKLIADYESLDGVYASLPTADLTPSVRGKLEAGKESAYLSQFLCRIDREVPLGIGLEDLKSDGINPCEAKALFIKFEFAAFIRRFGLDKLPQEEAAVCSQAVNEMPLDAFLKDLGGEVAVDLQGDVLLLSDGKSVCRTSSKVLELLTGKTLVCFDSKSLYKTEMGKRLDGFRIFDLSLGAYLVNSAKSVEQSSGLIADYLGKLPQTPANNVVYYLDVYRLLLKALEESGQMNLLLEMEMPLAKVLADMEIAGFRIDRQGIAEYGRQLNDAAKALEERIYFHAGTEFNINSPKQLGEVLFETLGLPHAKKTKTGYSTNAEILEKLRPYHEIIGDILDYRQVTKLKSTYADGLLKVADEKGRVHTNFKQTGTATGRLSSTEPNLQNIPIRTELGRELRRYFLPENRDYVIVDADYSQIELRLLAAISEDETMVTAFRNGADIHTSTAAKVFGIPPEQVTPELRKRAKAVNFGIMYGIGAFSLADDLGVSRADAKEYIESYLAEYPKIDAYLKNVIKEGYEKGFVTTFYGRRRYIPELSGSNKMLQKFGERVAMNSPIQGTAADIIKLAMIRVHRRLQEEKLDARLILQVHDELLVEANRNCAEKAKRILQEEMEGVGNFAVPLTVEIQVGENWFEAH